MIILKQGKTNWKFLLIVVILAAIVGGIALYCYPEFQKIELPPIQPAEKKVTIFTDKTEYNTNETVKITVKNNSGKSIWDFGICGNSPWWELQKLEDNKWRELNFSFPSLETGPSIPGMTKEIKSKCDYILCEKPELSELKPGSETSSEWKLYRSICEWPLQPIGIPETESKPIEKGIYRVFVIYGISKDFTSPEGKIIYSNEFTIKEEKSQVEKEQACINSGGTVKTGTCGEPGDFPNTCAIGACPPCYPEECHEVKICDCGEKKCWDGTECVQSLH